MVRFEDLRTGTKLAIGFGVVMTLSGVAVVSASEELSAAVVGGEVRSLAQRSAVAAKEIKTLIQDPVAKVESGAGLVTRSGDTLDEIVPR